jgi:hypothetical protein
LSYIAVIVPPLDIAPAITAVALGASTVVSSKAELNPAMLVSLDVYVVAPVSVAVIVAVITCDTLPFGRTIAPAPKLESPFHRKLSIIITPSRINQSSCVCFYHLKVF